jgi:hypothetical protein
LKMKRSRLQMALYSYGDGASQKRIDWQSCTTRVID